MRRSSFCIGECELTVNITDTWNEYLNRLDVYQKDIYFTEEYVKLYEEGIKELKSFIDSL